MRHPLRSFADRRLRRGLLVALVALSLGACLAPATSTPPTPTPLPEQPAATLPVVTRPMNRDFCWPFLMDQFGHDRPGTMADEVMAGTITIEPFAPFPLPADPTWTEAPYEGHRTWRFNYHSLRWVLPLLLIGSETGDRAMLDEAGRLLRDWVETNPRAGAPDEMAWDDHAAAWRALVFACAVEPIGKPVWLTTAMERHADALMDIDFRAVAGNLALNQDAGLIVMGCLLDQLDWIGSAISSLIPHVTESVDADGVSNEQSIQYQRYNLLNYRRVLSYVDWCARDLPEVEQRIDRMDDFLAYATDPLGRLLQIGDSIIVPAQDIGDPATRYVATAGAAGEAPTERLKIYPGGYAFLRSGWGEGVTRFKDETLFAFRFGPGRALHGHADHGAPILVSHGSRLLVDPGSKTLLDGDARDWVMSRDAHNAVVIDGRSWVASAGAAITTTCNDGRRFLGTVSGDGYGGATVSRTIAFDAEARVALLVDEVRQHDRRDALAARALFHAEAGATISIDGERATVTPASGEGRLLILSLTPGATATVIRGATDPLQGYVVDENRLVPAPVLSLARREVGPQWMTLILPYHDARLPVVVIERVRSGADWEVQLRLDGEPLRFAAATDCAAPGSE